MMAYVSPYQTTVDYMSVEIVDGRVQFKFDLGSGPLTLVSDKVVSDDSWREY